MSKRIVMELHVEGIDGFHVYGPALLGLVEGETGYFIVSSEMLKEAMQHSNMPGFARLAIKYEVMADPTQEEK